MRSVDTTFYKWVSLERTRKLVCRKRKRKLYLVPLEDYSAMFPRLILQHRQISTRLHSRALIPITKENGRLLSSALFVTAGESGRSRASM